ncbi:prolyl oligopeptidase family serine peptidase [Microbacteriaceae bacterium K1510]|nr:prolyl oligopeptidase family serine peptidase [Microbacteriaceae bacterium K1510]
MFEFVPGNYRWSYTTLLALAAGGQFGDIALALPKLSAKVGDDEAWHDAWAWLADTVERRAAGASAQTVSETFFLASLYHTISEHFIPPADLRRLESYGQVLRCFNVAMGSASFRMERVLVPYEEQTLPAYFLSAGEDDQPRPTVIFICGLDTTKELWFLRARLQFASRGMNCLFIDTPGIGEALRYQKIYTRADYERPVGAAVDYLLGRADVDRENIGLVGSSLGGYYVSRAAAFEPRLKATVAWGAIYDYHQVWVRRMTQGAISAAPSFQLMFITGTDNMEEAVRRVSDFKVAPFAGKIRCPFLIIHGAEDQQVPVSDAEKMLAALGSSDKELKIFDGANGGAAHTQFDNHLPALHVVADWMAKRLQSRP